MASDHVQHLVSIHGIALSIDHQAAIAITVQRDPQVGGLLDNGGLQLPQMRGTAAVIDVQSIRADADRPDLRAQFGKDRRRRTISRAVRTIQHDPQTAHRRPVIARLAVLDIATDRVVDS